MAEPEPYSSPRGVENAIKDAARRAASADPSLDVNKRIQLEYFNRFLSRVFSQADQLIRSKPVNQPHSRLQATPRPRIRPPTRRR